MAQQKDGMNQHKAMASGRGVTGMKKGGAVPGQKAAIPFKAAAKGGKACK